MCRLVLAILTLATQFLSPGPLAPFDSALVLILHAPRLAITINCETVRVVIRREFWVFFLFPDGLSRCGVYRVSVRPHVENCEGDEEGKEISARIINQHLSIYGHCIAPFFVQIFKFVFIFFKEFKWYLKRTKKNSIIIEFFQGVTPGNVSPRSFSGARIPLRNISYTLRNRVDESTLRFGRQRMRNSNTQMKSCTISPRLVVHLGFPYFYIFFLTLLFFFSIFLENVYHVYIRI